MGRLLAIALVVAAAGIAVVVVNGAGENKPEENEAVVPERQAPAEPAPVDAAITPTDSEQSGVRIRMRGLRFAPESVAVRQGQKVRFVNDDDVVHTVYQDLGATSGKSAAIDSARIQTGETFTFTATADGEIPFVCTLHPSVMQGQVLVEPDAA
jgi:plastocyanin